MTRILIVEDEASFSEALAFLLTKEGFETAVAEDGRQAINMFNSDGADLILLDLMIPEVSGVEVCRTIRTQSQVPIIMLTAKDAEIDKVVGLELGADDYVTKPYSSLRYSFLLALPAVFGSGFYQLQGAVSSTESNVFSLAETAVATGIAFVVGYLVIAWLLKFVSTRSFMPFIVYRIALGTLLLILLGTGVISA